VLAESLGARPGYCGLEEPGIACPHLAQGACRDVQQVLQVELDH
jgi:hypothetical protein